MDERTRLLLVAFAEGRIPTLIPDDCQYAAELRALSGHLTGCYQFAMDIARGDFSNNHGQLKGMLAGSLKALNANLRHLTWQTKQIAQGDLSQRIDFFGEFSSSFNSMVESLQEACAALVHLSTHDSLTGLYNRSYFDTELARVAAGRCFPAGIIVADLNGLKEVNDRYGHPVGDRLIQRGAEVLKGAFREADVVARIGGDEFAVIMPGAGEEALAASLERIRDFIGRDNRRRGRKEAPVLSVALGHAVAHNRHELKGTLCLADQRMYGDKRAQKQALLSAAVPDPIPAADPIPAPPPLASSQPRRPRSPGKRA
ncbi:hypothetical protein GMLC_07580 [Geomonas limicola]|uniref:diguanylate cyclase n=1 Tax=Geomonas limicola TaxID=2740186 RepID=A0A6V8N7B6_9BACT|nr:GGDEF domain-containing protein [Geomonas limicola]GFO67179.1 hypothetical protein GMLC_07580 [Geomonas limicola]